MKHELTLRRLPQDLTCSSSSSRTRRRALPVLLRRGCRAEPEIELLADCRRRQRTFCRRSAARGEDEVDHFPRRIAEEPLPQNT